MYKVCRDVFGTSGKKYLNFSSPSDLPRQVLRSSPPGSDTLVVVEDILSAQRVAESGYDAFPLLTTSLKEVQLEYLTRVYKDGILLVWLDDDNYSVLRDRDSIKRNLQLLHSNVKVIDRLGDPKNFTIEQVQEIINNV